MIPSSHPLEKYSSSSSTVSPLCFGFSTIVKEYKENGHAPVRDDRSSRDDHSSVCSHDPVIMPRTGSSKKSNKKEKEKDKRKSSAFKGFGSMFRRVESRACNSLLEFESEFESRVVC